MIFSKDRMAKLSGLMVESKEKGIKNAMPDNFGGGKVSHEAFLDGEVTTEGQEEEVVDEMEEEGDESAVREMIRNELRGAMSEMKHEKDEEEEVREMIRKELRAAKHEMKAEKAEEEGVREAVRREIRSVLRSRGVTLGGAGWGFKR